MSESCPHCAAPIDVELAWSRDGDNECEFDFDCPTCGATIGCHVEVTPTFSLSCKTNEESSRERFARFQR